MKKEKNYKKKICVTQQLVKANKNRNKIKSKLKYDAKKL